MAAPTATPAVSAPQSRELPIPGGRVAELIDLGSAAALLERVAEEMPGASEAVTAFWGPQWPRRVRVVAVATPEQFAALAGGSPDVAATTTGDRIVFSPGAGAMTTDDLRIVLRHELFHYAAHAQTASDAPLWVTEGVADYVGRPAAHARPPLPMVPPADALLANPGPARSAAYDRAWQIASWVADTYGPARLRALYLAACAPGHADVHTAMRSILGTDPTATPP